MSEDSIFDLSDASLEACLIFEVGVTVPVSISDLSCSSPSLLLELCFVTHGDVINLFCNNVDTADIL